MSVFSLRGSTALIALSLSLGLPLGLAAQETAPAPPAIAAEATSWVEVTRFGITFAIPPSATVAEDTDTETDRAYGVTTTGNGRIGSRMGLRVLTASDYAEAPTPGTPEFTSFLSDIGQVPVEPTGTVLQLGPYALHVYAGTGEMPGPDGTPIDTRMLFLVTHQPLEDGTGMLIAVFSAGLGGEVSAEVELDFVSSLRAEPVEDETPAEEDEDGASDETEAPAAVASAAPEAASETPEVSGAGAADTVVAEAEAPAADPFAELAAMLAEPAGVIPDGWTPVEAFGLRYALPPHETLRAEMLNETSSEAGYRNAAARFEIGSGIMIASPAALAELGGSPGDPLLTERLGNIARVPVVLSDRRIMLGDRPMALFIANGERMETPQVGGVQTGFYLIAEAPDADDNTLMFGVNYRGTGEEPAAEWLSQVLGSLSVIEAQAEVPETEAPVTEAPVTEAPVAEAPTTEAPAPEASALDIFTAALLDGFPAFAGTVPDGWTQYTRFGMQFAAPSDVTLEERERGNRTDVRVRVREADAEFEFGLANMTDPAFDRFGEPGTADFLERIAAGMGLPMVQLEQPIEIGGRSFLLYAGAGEVPEGTARLVLMVTPEHDADGRRLLILAGTRGHEDPAALALMRDALASLAAAPAAEATTEATTETPTDAPVADAGQAVELRPGMLSLAAMADMTPDAGPQANGGLTDLYLQTADGANVVRLLAGEMPRGFAQQVGRMMAEVHSVEATEVGGASAWVVRGYATRNLADEPAGAEAMVPATLVVPAHCLDGRPPYIMAMLTAPGDEARMATVLSSLEMSVPAGALPCDETVIAPVRAMIVAPQVAEVTPAPAPIPEDWEMLERFGIAFATPPGMRVRRDEDGLNTMEYWVEQQLAEGVSREVSLRVFSPEALGRLGIDTTDQAAIARELSTFSGLQVTPSDETMMLGDVTLSVYRGQGTRDRSGTPQPAQVMYLIAQTPAANGLSPWMAIFSGGLPPDQAAAFEMAVAASLSGSPVAPEPVSQPPEVTMPPVTEPPVTEPPVVQGPEDGKDPVAVTEPEPPVVPLEPPVVQMSPEAMAWAEAERAQTAEAMSAYLVAWPRGLHSGDARAWLRARGIPAPDDRPVVQTPPVPEFDAETEDWAAAMSQGRVEAFWTYLKRWPTGDHAVEAQQMIDHMLEGERLARPAVPAMPEPRPAAPAVPPAPPGGSK